MVLHLLGLFNNLQCSFLFEIYTENFYRQLPLPNLYIVIVVVLSNIALSRETFERSSHNLECAQIVPTIVNLVVFEVVTNNYCAVF